MNLMTLFNNKIQHQNATVTIGIIIINLIISLIKVKNVQKVKNGFADEALSIWTIKKVELDEGLVWPICLFNEGNKHDLDKTKYLVSGVSVSFTNNFN
jgi:hypothetical protein